MNCKYLQEMHALLSHVVPSTYARGAAGIRAMSARTLWCLHSLYKQMQALECMHLVVPMPTLQADTGA